MADVDVECQHRGEGWVCEVSVRETGGRTSHTVHVATQDHEALTSGSVGPEDLVRESFRFLLERESKESILAEFDLMTIERYFPEFSDTIRSRIESTE